MAFRHVISDSDGKLRRNLGKSIVTPSTEIVVPSPSIFRKGLGQSSPVESIQYVDSPKTSAIRKGLGKNMQSTTNLGSDPFADVVSLYLKGDGANGSTIFTDSSPFNRTVTRSGNTVISTAQSKYGGSSIYFDGDNDWLVTSYNPHQYTQNITIECWVYPTLLTKQSIFDLTRLQLNGLRCATDASGAFVQQVVVGAVLIRPGLTLNQWNHFAVSVYNNQFRVFTNGVMVSTPVTISPLLSSEGNVYIGTVNTGDFDFEGYIDSFRITQSTRYINNFNPETDTYLS